MFQHKLYKQFINDAAYTFQTDILSLLKKGGEVSVDVTINDNLPACMSSYPKQFKERVAKIYRSKESPIKFAHFKIYEGNTAFYFTIASGSGREDFVGLIMTFDCEPGFAYKLGWGENGNIAVMDWKEEETDDKVPVLVQ